MSVSLLLLAALVLLYLGSNRQISALVLTAALIVGVLLASC
jgi:hypothetical protein